MWPRVVELMLGLWLAISPLILGIDLLGFTAWNGYVCSVLVVTASCFSYWPRARYARALTAAVALWLAGHAYITGWGGPHPAPSELHNELTVGLLLLMFAIVPNEANRPPIEWRRWVDSSSSQFEQSSS